ncbi:MAG: hypothetical protein WCT12_04290 [Verrucomicrobiota bacterium]
MKALHSLALMGIAALMAANLCGCAWVNRTSVPNTPGSGTALTTGAPHETLTYFQQVYPPKGWPSENARYRAAVCPLLVSREAVLFLSGESSQKILAHAEVGNAKVMAVVQNKPGQPQFYVAERLSDKAQAILMEELLAKGPFEVINTSKTGFLAEEFFDDLEKKAVPLCVLGCLDSEGANAKEVWVYLRLVDTSTRAVRCAVSAQGATLDEAVRQGAAKLVKSLNR